MSKYEDLSNVPKDEMIAIGDRLDILIDNKGAYVTQQTEEYQEMLWLLLEYAHA